MTTPRIDTVTVTPEDDGAYLVTPTWTGADRTDGTGYLLGNRKTAERLATAMRAGAVFLNPTVATDVNGRTYVSARSTVLGRTANADLKRLGY